MKSYVISDNRDTWVGMGLAGIEGIIVHEREIFLDMMRRMMKDESVGIIILTEKIARLAPNEVLAWKLKAVRPLIIEIPDRHGTMYEESVVMHYIKGSIGSK